MYHVIVYKNGLVVMFVFLYTILQNKCFLESYRAKVEKPRR